MKHYNINLYPIFSNLKAAICKRFNRTLNNKMWMQFSLQGNYKWLNILSDHIFSYNVTKHQTIKMKPKGVTKQDKKEILYNVCENFKVTTLRKDIRTNFKLVIKSE